MNPLLESTKEQRLKQRQKVKNYQIFCNVLAPILAIIAIIVIWQLVVTKNNVPAWKFPAASAVFSSMVLDFKSYLPHIWRTFSTILVGWTCACVIGVLLAGIICNFPLVGTALTPYLNLLCTLPIITMVPMMYVFMGVGRKVIIIAVILQSFAIVNLNSVTGFLNVPLVRQELMTSLRATRLQTFFRCILPSALPSVFTGMRLSAIFATTTCISSELCGSMVGLGAKIITAKQFMDSSGIFASIFFIAIIGIFFYLLISVLEAKIVTWKD